MNNYSQNTFIYSKFTILFLLSDQPNFHRGKIWLKEYSLRCLPYFYIAGFSKCGTTDLHANLMQHQHILPGLYKEPRFWDESRYLYILYSLLYMNCQQGKLHQIVLKIFTRIEVKQSFHLKSGSFYG
jgi:hypothetical protein